MRRLLLLGGLLTYSATAAADPRCGRLGEASYSASRITTIASEPPQLARVFVSGARIRVEMAGPSNGQMVMLMTPELSAIFLTTARPPVALRLTPPPQAPTPTEDRRLREERGLGRVTFITEARGASGQWHEVERTVCRGDGVLLEARQWQPHAGGAIVVETRQTDIRLATHSPALFRPPAGFRLAEPPPAHEIRAGSASQQGLRGINPRTAPPPG